MTKLEEFKDFVKTIPSIKDDVLNHRYTWQQLYEMYELYGKDDKFWLPYKNESNNLDLVNLFEIVKNIDVNALITSMQAVEKVLTMASGLFVKEDAPKPTSKAKWYDES